MASAPSQLLHATRACANVFAISSSSSVKRAATAQGSLFAQARRSLQCSRRHAEPLTRVGRPLSRGFSSSARRASISSSANSNSQSGPKSDQRQSSTLASLLAFGAIAGGAYLLGSFFPPAYLRLIFPPPAPPAPTAESEAGKALVANVEDGLLQLAAVKELRERKSIDAKDSEGGEDKPHYMQVRPYSRYPQERARHSLTAGSLRGPGKIATHPLVMSKTEHGALQEGGKRGDGVAFLHVGRSVCGHDGVVHGGLIATIFDEALARTAFYNLPNNVGVTARLEVNYRKPTMADQYVKLETWLVEAKGRKAIVKGRMLDMHGLVLAEADSVFVEPKFAKYINTNTAKEFLEG